jgi:DNA-binding NarL/FixJ family response regulator
MTMTSGGVVCATRRTVFATAFREIVQRAGFTRGLVTVPPTQLFDAVKDNPGCLVIIDGNSAPFCHSLAEAQKGAPDSRFVLCSNRVTPLLVREAFECGLHGVLSSRLPVDDAAQALTRICQGERQFRFDAPQTRFVGPCRVEPARDMSAAPPPENRVVSRRRVEPARDTAAAPPPENRVASPCPVEPARDMSAAPPPENRVVSRRRVETARETAAAPPPDPSDFDALWMFECRPGV